MRKWFFLVALVSLSFLAPACSRPTDPAAEEKSVRETFEKYLKSVDSADTALASQVWSQSPDVEVVTPFGRSKGWETVRDKLYVDFLQKAFLERSLKPENLVIKVSGDTAWAVFDWSFTAKLANGQPFSSKGWESHVYQKADKRWTIVHLHYSAPIPAPPPQ